MPLLSDAHAAPPATEIEEHTPLQAGAALYPALPQPYPGSYGVPEQPPPYAPPPYEHHDYPTKVWAHPSLSVRKTNRHRPPRKDLSFSQRADLLFRTTATADPPWLRDAGLQQLDRVEKIDGKDLSGLWKGDVSEHGKLCLCASFRLWGHLNLPLTVMTKKSENWQNDRFYSSF